MEWADGQLTLTLNFANFLQLTDDPLYFEAYLQSLQVAGISTICCLLLGYPLAWAVAHSKPSTRNIPAAVGDPPVVDLVFDPRLCLDGAAEEQRGVE